MASIRQAGRYGIQVGEPELDMEVLHERKDLIIEGLRMGIERLLFERGVVLVEGKGQLVAPDTVKANGQQLRVCNIVISDRRYGKILGFQIMAPGAVRSADPGPIPSADGSSASPTGRVCQPASQGGKPGLSWRGCGSLGAQLPPG